MFKIKPKFNNSSGYYKYRHPDLVPRNVYLRNGRMVNVEKMNKTIRDFGASPVERFFNFIKDTYNKIIRRFGF